MRFGVLSSLLALVAPIAAASPDSGSGKPEMVSLTPESFKDNNMLGLWYVKFFSPYCAKCLEVAPKWTAAFEKYGGNDETLSWGEVNCSEQGDLCSEQNIKKFPQIHVYKDNEFVATFEYALEEEDFYLFARNLQKFGAEGVNASVAEMREIIDQEEKERNMTPEETETRLQNAHEKVVEANTAASLSSMAENVIIEIGEKEWTPARMNKLWLVRFHSPYSSESKDRVASWKQAFQELGGIFGTWGMGMIWAEVDCHKNAVLCKRLDITEFPSLRVFLDNEWLHTYDGKPTVEGIKEFAKEAVDKWAPRDTEGKVLEFNFARDKDLADENEKETATRPVISDDALADAIDYALRTAGKRVDADPGLLIFGSDAEAQHNIRLFSEPDAPPPNWDDVKATHNTGASVTLSEEDYRTFTTNGEEPWFIKFFMPGCPHCQALAPEWKKLAEITAGKVNIGEVNCQENRALCSEVGIKRVPTMRFYDQHKLQPDYTGSLEATAMEMYTLTQMGGHIIPIDSEEEVWGNVTINNGEDRASFIFVYDKSVRDEDWRALAKFSSLLTSFDGVVYRSNNNDVRDKFSIHHHGSTLAYLGVVDDEDTATGHFAIPYRLSNNPIKLRDPVGLYDWARQVRYSGAQLLQLSELPVMNTLAPAHAVYLLPEGSGNLPEEVTKELYQYRKLAYDLYEESDSRRIKRENELRVARLVATDDAVAKGNYRLANKIETAMAEVPFELNITLNYMHIDQWKEQFGGFFDVSAHKEGAVVVFDPANARIVDSVTGERIRPGDKNAIVKAYEALNSYAINRSPVVSKGLKSVPNVKPFIPAKTMNFEDLSTGFWKKGGFESKYLFLLFVVIGAFFGYRRLARPSLRKHGRGAILTGKFD